jgi:DHA1 family multidrug resistance protein-like MFS transporter
MPFLPLYFAELGARDVGEVAFWSGISLGITPAMTALLAPVWGRVADRFGTKVMLQRSLVSFIVIMAAMAFVTRPWHVFALRALQGLFAGYGALALAMAAHSAPPGGMTAAIGTVQTAQRLGPALGPVVGGGLAQLVGLRRAFLISAVFYLVGVALVAVLYREPPRAEPQRRTGDGRVTFGNVLAFEHFLVLMAVIFTMQFVDRSLGPVLPLYLAELGFSASGVAGMSGVLFSTIAVTAAIGHNACARLLAWQPASTVIVVGACVAGIGIALVLGVPRALVLVAAAAIFGIAVGIAMTAAYTTAGSVMPAEVRATGFGVLSSASLAAMAMSPMASGFIGARGLWLVFVVDLALLLLIAILVRRTMGPRARERAQAAHHEAGAPVVDEE